MKIKEIEDVVDFILINEILTKHSKERENLSLVLQEIHEKVGYISKEMMEKVADFFALSAADVYTLVTLRVAFKIRC